jgi:hypothetical protein
LASSRKNYKKFNLGLNLRKINIKIDNFVGVPYNSLHYHEQVIDVVWLFIKILACSEAEFEALIIDLFTPAGKSQAFVDIVVLLLHY